MRVDPLPIYMRQQASKPQQPIYRDAPEPKANAKIDFMKAVANSEQNAFINYALALSEARVQAVKQFLAAEEVYYPWVTSSVSELGTVLIGNILDTYA